MDILGTTVITKVSSAETGGAYYVFHLLIPPSGGIPAHVHENEDEIFCIIEGDLEITVDGSVVNCTKGDVQNLPRGIVHGIKNTSNSESKSIVFITPGSSFEDFFSKLTLLSKGPDTDMGEVIKLSAEYGIKFV
ncbi:MAG TPA: cupin domain-containing protein [Thermodesulfobacteriota bacterium]|nr:cupin domain-containing protein [Thermodesulfobacteriota bacterium]